MKISVVIPVFKGEKTLEKLINRLDFVLPSLGDWEAVLVHDCGPDNSWSVIEDLKERFPEKITGIKLRKNFGQHISTLLGMCYVTGDIVVTLDEDLQYYPEDIVPLIERIKIGYADLVYGTPGIQFHNRFKKAGSSFLRTILKLSIPKFQYNYSSLRVIGRDLTNRMLISEFPYFFIDATLNNLNPEVTSLSINHYPREAGSSSYTYFKLAKHAATIILAYTKFLNKTLMISVIFLIGLLITLLFILLTSGKLSLSFTFLSIGLMLIMGLSYFLQIYYRKQTCKMLYKNSESFIEKII